MAQIDNSAEIMNFSPEMSTDSISVGDNATLCLTDYLEALEGDVAAKAPMSHSHGEYLSEEDAVAAFAMANHTHPGYLSEEDAVAAFAMANHTHTGYAPASHAHPELVETMDALDTAIGGKAEASHTHAQSEVTGLVEKLAEIDEAIVALQAGGESGGAPVPVLTLSMHMGKLDNNSGAEVSSSTRICSEPFPVENGKSYWQVNDKGVNMYVLLYDADELFLEYMGNFTSGAEIAVTNANAAYMRLGSLLGNYDLTNNYYIYDTDPAGGAGEEDVEVFTQADADLLYAPISHTHDGFAAAEHTHDYAAADHTHTGFAASEHTHEGYAATAHTHTAADITGLPSSVDAYSKTQMDNLLAQKADLVNGVIPDQQLPSYMDDVIEGTLSNSITFRDSMGIKMPAANDKIYVDTTTNKCYRWSGSTYVEIGGGGVALGETSATAHRGDHGKIAYDHSQNADVHVTAAQKNSWDSKADAGHTHTASQVGAAASSHTHTYSEVGAASSSHTHTPASIGAAASSHTHTGYASSSHDHDDDYAPKSHTHHPANIGALSSSGGTIDGALTVMLDSIFNGVLNTQKIQPKDSGSYSIGTDSNRYYSTYLRVNPNVSSDRRCKRDIAALNVDTLAEFVNNLSVVAYNYNDDAEDEAKKMGLIAQDVIAVDPGIAAFFVEQGESGLYSIRPADFVFPLIAAVQVLTKRVEELEGK